jgi:hypothetical protein
MPARRRSRPRVLRVELSPGFRDDLKRQPRTIQRAVADFIRRKSRGEHIHGKEKASGYRADGSVVNQAFVDLRLHHFHIGDPDPLLVYQLRERDRRLRLIAIVDHDDIFRGNERDFLDRYDDDLADAE